MTTPLSICLSPSDRRMIFLEAQTSFQEDEIRVMLFPEPGRVERKVEYLAGLWGELDTVHKHTKSDKQALDLSGKESGKRITWLLSGDVLDKTNRPHYTHL